LLVAILCEIARRSKCRIGVRFKSSDTAKERVRNLLVSHASIEVWNEDETWQVVTPNGVEAWSKS
jgi:hypothetical protein